jgi:hypothetical protein
VPGPPPTRTALTFLLADTRKSVRRVPADVLVVLLDPGDVIGAAFSISSRSGPRTWRGPVWAAVILIHLASYVPKLPRMLSGRADDARHLLAARATRWLLLCGSLATYHLSARFGGSGSIIP